MDHAKAEDGEKVLVSVLQQYLPIWNIDLTPLESGTEETWSLVVAAQEGVPVHTAVGIRRSGHLKCVLFLMMSSVNTVPLALTGLSAQD